MTITKSGELASFYTVNKAPIKHLKVYFSPKQAGEGTPSPENVREISGWNNITTVHTGKNLIISDDPTNLEKTYTHTSNGSTLYDASTQSVYSQGNGVSLLRHWNAQMNTAGSNYLFIAPDDIIVSYSINISHDNTQDFTSWPIRLMKNDEQWSYYRRDKDSSASNLCHKRENVQLSKNDCLTGTFYGGVYWKNLQIEIGPEATKYEPYRGQTHTIDWTEDVGTVYGGYVDLVTGELVETDWGVVLDGSSDEFWAANGTDGFYTQPQTTKPMETILYCNQYKVHQGRMTTRDMSEGEIAMNATGWAVQVFDTSQADWRAYLNENPLQLVGHLIEPIVHQLTPTQLSTLIGRNNIWSNTDRVEVEYDLAESNDELYRRRNILLRSTPHIETASGNIAHFETDIAAPIKSAKISFSPVQEGSGDPSPTNVRPISGFINLSLYHSGENLYVPNSNNKGYISKSGVITVDETSTYTDLIPVNLGDVYSFECTTVSVNGDTNRRIHGYNSSGTWVKQLASGTTAANTVEYRKISATIPADISYIRVSFRNQDTDVRITKENVVTADWQTAAGTIYGGYVDLINGILVQTHAHTVLDGSFAPAIFPWGKEYIDKNTGETLVNILYRKSDTGDNIHNGNFEYFYADSLKQISIYRTNEMGISMYDGDTYSICLTLPKNLVGSTNETLALYLSEHPCEVVFTLKTPITHTLTPAQLKSLKGTNNIWSNTNETIEVKYWRH